MTAGVAHDGAVWVRGERCANCLLSPDRIVSGSRAAQIIRETAHDDGGPFVCHKNQTEGEPSAICRGWYDKLGDRVTSIRMAQVLGLIRYTYPWLPEVDCWGDVRSLLPEAVGMVDAYHARVEVSR